MPPTSFASTLPKVMTSNKFVLFFVVALPWLAMLKRVPAEITVGSTVLVGLYLAFKYKQYTWLNQSWVWAAAALSAILLILSPFSVIPSYSALSAVLAFRWPIYAAVLIWLFITHTKSIDWFERSVLALVIFIIIDTLIQYFIGHDMFGIPRVSLTRLSGPFDHPLVGTFTARYWFIALAVVWFAVMRTRAIWALLAIALMSAIGALFLFLTGERAALLTFLLGSGLVMLGLMIHHPRWRMPLIGLLLVLGVTVAGVAVTQKEMVQRSVDSTIQTITHLDDSVYGLNFETAWAEFLQHPLTGVGAREFMHYANAHLPTYKERYKQFGFEDGVVIHPHNFYTGMLAEGGVFSFLIFVIMVSLLFWKAGRDAFRSGIPMQAYFAGALLLVTFWPIQSSMEYFNGWTSAVVWTGVAWALARARINPLTQGS